jgi:hypothetical protein
MKNLNWFLTLGIAILVSFALVGCYTTFGFVQQETGYEDEEISAAEADQNAVSDDTLPCCDQVNNHYYIHDRYFYDPWCWEPGFYVSVGFGWNYFDPYWYYPPYYSPYYYPYVAYPYPFIYPWGYPVWYYEPGYSYAYNYERRPFVRRSQYLPARRGMNLGERMELATAGSRPRVGLRDRNRELLSDNSNGIAVKRAGYVNGTETAPRGTAIKTRVNNRTSSQQTSGKTTRNRRETINSRTQQTTGRTGTESTTTTRDNSGRRGTVKRNEAPASGTVDQNRNDNSSSDNDRPAVTRPSSGSDHSTPARSSSGSDRSSSGSRSSGSSGRSYSSPSSSHGSSSGGGYSGTRSSSGSSGGSGRSGSSGSGGRRR